MQSRKTRYRLSMKRSLPADLDAAQREQVLLDFEHACALTRSTEHITLDHFIPIEWGHGGTYAGNMYPLQQQLNKHKSNKNPFKWIKALRRDKNLRKGQHVDGAWNRLIAYLALQNGLTVNEFKVFVDWCEQHKRTVEEVNRDTRRSLDIWKESKKE